ncbi:MULTISPECIES: hypothetical protein [Yersinia pseudotuberculosis complex]|uniref:hypothetical protein n=1 Tax=Yersinia pseudotuberculosis complex TaxID=1649845 RepID=UPI0008FFC13C|nr:MULTISPECIES: hypothetical protein [Yersinia pseudotuberculosis complex]MCE4114123.1 hypothetical protein [Yersinia pseudotuberculosis]MCF1164451.1 hypothetical protein [Yersinia pseudotuberculosis]RYC23830.1 hypothetical protein EU971_16180 [Yersinia pseudotuberculosis]WLF03015.1 hypothetical protein Q6G25_15600 [Yersinia pseudotuberculosis]
MLFFSLCPYHAPFSECYSRYKYSLIPINIILLERKNSSVITELLSLSCSSELSVTAPFAS